MRYFQLSKLGGNNIEEVEGWLTKLEYNFYIKGYDSKIKIVVDTLHLSESSFEWWNT